jgi:hypothetical protein
MSGARSQWCSAGFEENECQILAWPILANARTRPINESEVCDLAIFKKKR